MSAERDNNVELRNGVNYSVGEMLYLLEVSKVLKVLDEDSRNNLESIINTLEVLPNSSLVRFEIDRETKPSILL